VDTSLYKSDHVSVNGIRLHYLDWGGHGPVLVFLAGMGCTAHIFERFAPRFRDRFHVLALTRRGHRDSDYLSSDDMTEEQKAQVIDYFNTALLSSARNSIEQFRRKAPHAKIVVIPSGHHYCFIRHEELVFNEMIQFLSSRQRNLHADQLRV